MASNELPSEQYVLIGNVEVLMSLHSLDYKAADSETRILQVK